MSLHPPQDYESLRAQMSERYNSLSKRLRQIAKFAWDNPTIMAMETTSVIAERAGVQPSALIRFAKAFGYSGFTEMQRPFQAHVTERSASYKERFRDVASTGAATPGHGPLGLLEQFCEANRAALEFLQEGIDGKSLEQAVALLQQARHIYVMGQRRSFPVASYISYNLNHVECRAQLLHGLGGMLFEHAQTMSEGDVLIATSFSPYSEETAQVVNLACKRKIPVIVISDSSLNNIAKAATVCFDVHDAEVYSFRSLTASMCLAQALCTALAMDRNGDGGSDAARKPARKRSLSKEKHT